MLCSPPFSVLFVCLEKMSFKKVDKLLMSNKWPYLYQNPESKGALTLQKRDILWSLFPEVNGNLAQLALKAGNAMPALMVKQRYHFSCRVAQRTRNTAARRWQPGDISVELRPDFPCSRCRKGGGQKNKMKSCRELFIESLSTTLFFFLPLPKTKFFPLRNDFKNWVLCFSLNIS